MVTWEKKSDLLVGQEPSHLLSVLKDIEEGEFWKWFTTCLRKEAENHRRRIGNSIEANRDGTGFNFQSILDTNRNIFTAKTLECIPDLVRAAKALCLEQMKKGEPRM